MKKPTVTHPNLTAPPPLGTIRDAAAATRTCERTIRNWIAAGRISAFKIGKVVRVDLEKMRRELAAFEHTAA